MDQVHHTIFRSTGYHQGLIPSVYFQVHYQVKEVSQMVKIGVKK